MKSIIDNLINGNLKEAKRQAKRFGFVKLRNALMEHGFPFNRAHYATSFLKEGTHYQEYCDAK